MLYFQKLQYIPKDCAITPVWIRIEKKISVPLCLKISLSHGKIDIWWFQCEKLKISERKYICKIKQKLEYFIPF